MALEEFTKQPYEAFVIAGDFTKALDTNETLIVGNCIVTAVDKDGINATSEIVDALSKTVSGGFLNTRIQGGSQDKSKYKITFRTGDTSDGNRYELDVKMKIKET